MSRVSFETVAAAQRQARRRLPTSLYNALIAGSQAGMTAEDNVAAFAELGFGPRLADLPAQRDQATHVMGTDLALPVLLSPVGAQIVHPDGEVAAARAATSRGTAMGLSSFASKPIEAVAAANPRTFFQLYWSGSRNLIRQRVDRARAAGAAGLIITLDWSFARGRDCGSPRIPEHFTLRETVRFAPEALARPRWLASFARTGRLPDASAPNMGVPGSPAPSFSEAYREWLRTPPPSWQDVAWLRNQWDGPFMIKGVCRVDDARRAVGIGASAISVSNHGGNNLDGTPAAIRLLPAIAAAVGDEVEVMLDGGIRRGSDVVKALALGARAVMIGRAQLWGLAAAGQSGVESVLDILRSGIDSTLLGLGRSSVGSLGLGDILVPDRFARVLGDRDPVGAD